MRDRRLLIFCDSRQDASHQARYIKGSEEEVGVKREILRAIETCEGPSDFSGLSERLVPGLEAIGVLLPGKTAEAKKRNRQRALGQLLREFVLNVNRRDSLERYGLVRVLYAGLDEELASPGFAEIAERFDLDPSKLAPLVPLVLDAMRAAGGAHLDAIKETEDPLRERVFAWTERDETSSLAGQYGLRVSRNTGKPVAFREPNDTGEATRDYVLRVMYSRVRGGPLRELLSRLKTLSTPADRLDLADEVFRWLRDHGFIRQVSIGKGKSRKTGFSVPLATVEIARATSASQCTVCQRVVGDAAGQLHCTKASCDGALVPYLHSDDVERELLQSPAATRLIPREHSAAIGADERDEIERKFQLQPPEVNVLACTPTLELGVNIGALEAVAMRNVPPNPANYAQRAGRTGRKSQMGIVTTFALQRSHDAYFFDHPEEMIAGAIPAPRFNLENLEGLARHVRSVALETAKLEYPKDIAKYIKEEGEVDAVALQEVRTAIEGAYAEARKRASQAFGSIDGVTLEWVAARVAETAGRVEDAILQRAEAIKLAALQMHELDAVAEQRQKERRQWRDLAVALRLGSDGNQQAYLLRILAESGIIPGYAFPRDPGSLTLGFDPQPLQAGRVQAQREYAPGQIVYARGRRWQVTRLAIFRPDLGGRPSAEAFDFVECGSCGHANRADANACVRPSCGAALEGQARNYIDVGAFQAMQRDVDPLSEEERRRERVDQRAHPRYDVERTSYVLGASDGEGLQLGLSHGESILYLNHGRQERGKAVTQPYRLCLSCGETFDPPVQPKPKSGKRKKAAPQPPSEPIYSEAEVKHRDPSRCGGKVADYAIGHEVKSDILRLQIPPFIANSAESGKVWAWSVAAAVIAGAVRAYDLDEDDLEPLVVTERDAEGKERPVEILWIDDVVGGSGILDEMVADFDRIAQAALQHLQGHLDGRGCERSCYQCLRTYRTSWRGDVFDWHAAIGFLRNAARLTLAPGSVIAAAGDETSSPEWQRAQAEGCDSPIELRLLEAIRAAGLPEPQKQYQLDHPETGRLLTIADFAYPEQHLLIYVDGLAWHNTRRQRILDARQQRLLQDMGWNVQRYLGSELWSDAGACAREVARTLVADPSPVA